MTMKKIHLTAKMLLPGLLLANNPASGAITYIDAQEGINTFATGGSLGDQSWIDTTTNGAGIDDDDWMKRFGPGATNPGWTQHNGGDVIQGTVSTTPSALGEITTEITGLSDGTYNVWVFFWEQVTSDVQDWVIDAGLTSGSTASYSSPAGPVTGSDFATPVNASTLTFSNSPSVVGAGGNQNMFGVNLGTDTVTGGSSIEVYIDKLFGNGGNNRTIFDGVGYELVIPEPSSSLLLALGGLALTGRRRR